MKWQLLHVDHGDQLYVIAAKHSNQSRHGHPVKCSSRGFAVGDMTAKGYVGEHAAAFKLSVICFKSDQRQICNAC